MERRFCGLEDVVVFHDLGSFSVGQATQLRDRLAPRPSGTTSALQMMAIDRSRS
jgi:hypothetical protein